MPAYCGVYLGRRCLVAVSVDADGRASTPIRAGRSPTAEWQMLVDVETNCGLDIELVLPDWLARAGSVAPFAAARQIPVWLAPAALIADVRLAANARRPDHVAAIIARLPLTSRLRNELRHVRAPDGRQMA